jgi:uncharacterized protein (DUF433 family)
MNTSLDSPLTIQAQPLPIALDADGVARIANTRVTLDTVVTAFLDGASAEEIAYQYSSISLSDIYAVIGYYLRNQHAVDEYLQQRIRKNVDVRRENEKKFAPQGIRQRLLARKDKVA